MLPSLRRNATAKPSTAVKPVKASTSVASPFAVELTPSLLADLCLIAAARKVDYLTALSQLIAESKTTLVITAAGTTSKLIADKYK